MKLQLKISGFHHEILINHLLPDDGREAVAVALCGRYDEGNNHFIMIHDLILIPHNECYNREFDVLHWPTERIRQYFERINKTSFAILKIHSHPGGYDKFSKTDDLSDKEFFDSVFGWSINDKPHASAVMLPGGKIFGRFFFSDLSHKPIDSVSIVGDTIIKYINLEKIANNEFALRTIQTFGDNTYQVLNRLTVGVVGCSGTGSPVIEQLVRLGIGKIVLVDPDNIEKKNLNRILNATSEDADNQRAKVVVLSEAIERIGLGTKVESRKFNLFDDIGTLKELIKCDVVFGCMDSVDGRYILNQLCCFYLLPYFDLGVKLEADGIGGIKQICGSVHYIQPCKSSLISRGIYNLEELRAASQYRKNPNEFEELEKNAYIKNINVNNPAVISVNMQIASHAVNEFLNRIHPFKIEHPSYYAGSTIDITQGYIVNSNELDYEVDTYLKNKSGRGDTNPFIEITELLS